MAGGQLGMVVIVWAFSFVSGVFGFEEEASAFKVSSQDKQFYFWLRHQWRMENIRDLAYEGWMSKTSRKGKGPGKNKGRAGSGEAGSEEDRSWGKESVNLRKKICKELGRPEVEGPMEAVASGSGTQGSVKERDSVVEERTEDGSSSEDEDGEDGSEEGEAGSSEIKVVDEVRKDRR